jgi:hypothetical protein
LMAAERHLEQILERRRGMRMVLTSSILLSMHSRKISDNNSIGSLPEGPWANSDAPEEEETYRRAYDDTAKDIFR